MDELLQRAEEMLKADPSRAIYYSNSAIAIAQKLEDKSHLAMALATLGEAYMNQGDFDMGFGALTQAEENCPADSSRLNAYIYVRLSSSYLKLRDLDKAFDYVDRAADIYRMLHDSLNLARCYNSQGLVHIQVPDNKRAEVSFKAALEINRRIGNRKAVASNLNNLCLYEGDTREKIGMLYEAIAINDSLGAIWSLGENYNNLGTQYYYGGDYTRSLQALDSAMLYARRINAKELISDNYRYASWSYAAMHDFENAYSHLLSLYEAELELLAMNEMRQIELNVIQKRLRDREQQMVMQQQAFKIRSLRQWLFIGLLLFVALSVSLSYLFHHYRQGKKLQSMVAARRLDEQEKELMTLRLQQAEHEAKESQLELEHSRHELVNFSFFLRSRNDMLQNIGQMIKEGYRLTGVEAERHQRSIHAYISQFSARNTESELLIDEVNARFIEKLSQLHPDLSKNEQRLASLLRIGLSTKEIASLINSSPKTVNMARYRLRKHLNLDSDHGLAAYMQQI